MNGLLEEAARETLRAYVRQKVKRSRSEDLHPTAAVFRDYDPERPLAKLESRALSFAPFTSSGTETVAGVATELGSAVGSAGTGLTSDLGSAAATYAGAAASAVETALGADAPPYLEVYDHHGPFLFPKWEVPSDEAPRMLRQERRRAVTARARGGCPDVGAAHKLAIAGHPIARLDRTYVVTTAEHRGRTHPTKRAPDRYTVYENTFECTLSTVPYVPPKPPRRSVQVSLTAKVVGPPGEEIHVDAMGQIKVQFHWDRDGKDDGKSTCWIRTMHPWGGAGRGVQFIPRVGMEVVVTFEGGDPDKPMVVGCLYNATHPSPFMLPAEKTRSGFRTQSSPGGDKFNELSFEDAARSEQVFLHAAKNLDEVVRHNHTLEVDNDEAIRVHGNRVDTVERNLNEHVHGDHATEVVGHRLSVVNGNLDFRVAGMSTTRGCPNFFLDHFDRFEPHRRKVVAPGPRRVIKAHGWRTDTRCPTLNGQWSACSFRNVGDRSQFWRIDAS